MDANGNDNDLKKILDYLDIAIDQCRAVYEAWSIYNYVFAIYQDIKSQDDKKYLQKRSRNIEGELNGIEESRKDERKEFAERFSRLRPYLMFISFCVIITLLMPYFERIPRNTMVKTVIFVIPVILVIVFILLPLCISHVLVPELEKRHKARLRKRSISDEVLFWEEQKTIALDRYKEAQDVLEDIKRQYIISEPYFDFASLCSIRGYLRSGRCSELEGKNGAYAAYLLDKQNNIITELQDQFSTDNENIRKNQTELYEELLKADSIIESIKEEYDNCVLYENKAGYGSGRFPVRTRYFETRKKIEAKYIKR